jgi:hypothetical protein
MIIDEFKQSLQEEQVPQGLSQVLESLWLDAKGDWEAAHMVVQDIETKEAAWIHAYLHRKEGDAANAAYWYRRAGKPVFTAGLEQEWESIVKALL